MNAVCTKISNHYSYTRTGAISPTPISPTYYRTVPFRLLKQNATKTVKTSVQVYKVKGIVQKQEIKSISLKDIMSLEYSSKLIRSWLNLVLQFSCSCQQTSLLSLFLLEDLNKFEHIGVNFPCNSLQLVVPSLEVVVDLGAAHRESSLQCFKLTFTSFYFFAVPPLLL